MIGIRHSRGSGNPAARVRGPYESYDARTRFWIPACAGMTVIFALAATSPARADIVWAEAGPYTGSVASIGTSQEAGAKQAVDDINAADGINGEKITLKTYDDACDPKQAVTVADRIISENIPFAIHATCSSSALASEKAYIDEGTLVLNPTASNPKFTDDGAPNIFRAMYRDDGAANVIGSYIKKHFADKKLAILNDKSAYGLGIAEMTRDYVNKNGIKEIMYETYDPTNHDYSVLSARLKEQGAQVVFIAGMPSDIALITRQLRESGSKAQVIGGDLSVPEFWKITGATGEGTLFAFAKDPRKAPGAQAVLAKLEKAGVVVDGYTLYAYAAAQALAQAIADAKSLDPSKVSAAMHKEEFNTILGKWSFDAKGDVRNIHQVMFRWHNGEFEEVGE